MATISTASSTTASAHTTVANARSPGTRSGRLTAAVATMPVPMTDAKRFGVGVTITTVPGRRPGR